MYIWPSGHKRNPRSGRFGDFALPAVVVDELREGLAGARLGMLGRVAHGNYPHDVLVVGYPQDRAHLLLGVPAAPAGAQPQVLRLQQQIPHGDGGVPDGLFQAGVGEFPKVKETTYNPTLTLLPIRKSKIYWRYYYGSELNLHPMR